MLVIAPWEPKMISEIEKAIQKSDLGINPSNDGKVIRLVVPELNEERRKELCKQVKKQIEEGKVAIRNTRRDTMDQIKKMKKDSTITEDDLKQAETEMQKVTGRAHQDAGQGGRGQGKGDHVDLMLKKLTGLLVRKPRRASAAPRLDGARLALPEKLPRHVGIIMDGNGRWAQRARPAAFGGPRRRHRGSARHHPGLRRLGHLRPFHLRLLHGELGAAQGRSRRADEPHPPLLPVRDRRTGRKGRGHPHHRRYRRPAGQAARNGCCAPWSARRATTDCASTSPSTTAATPS